MCSVVFVLLFACVFCFHCCSFHRFLQANGVSMTSYTVNKRALPVCNCVSNQPIHGTRCVSGSRFLCSCSQIGFFCVVFSFLSSFCLFPRCAAQVFFSGPPPTFKITVAPLDASNHNQTQHSYFDTVDFDQWGLWNGTSHGSGPTYRGCWNIPFAGVWEIKTHISLSNFSALLLLNH